MRFSRIYENVDFKKKARKKILNCLEKLFAIIPEIIFLVNEKILEKINNFQEVENWDLVTCSFRFFVLTFFRMLHFAGL